MTDAGRPENEPAYVPRWAPTGQTPAVPSGGLGASGTAVEGAGPGADGQRPVASSFGAAGESLSSGDARRPATQPLAGQPGTGPIAPLVRPFTSAALPVVPAADSVSFESEPVLAAAAPLAAGARAATSDSWTAPIGAHQVPRSAQHGSSSAPAGVAGGTSIGAQPLSPYSLGGGATTSWGAAGIATSGVLGAAGGNGTAVPPGRSAGVAAGASSDISDGAASGNAGGPAGGGIGGGAAGGFRSWPDGGGFRAGRADAGSGGAAGSGDGSGASGGGSFGGDDADGGSGEGPGSHRPKWLVPVVAGVAVLVVGAVGIAVGLSRGGSDAAPTLTPVPAKTVVMPSPTPTVAPVDRAAATPFSKALPASLLQYALKSDAPSADWVAAGALEAYTDTYVDGGSGTVTVVAGQFETADAASAFATTLTAALPKATSSPSAKATPALPQNGDVQVAGAKAGTYAIVDAGDGTGVAVWTNGTTVFRATAPLADIASVYAAYPL
jgi:hypothetical protein